MCYLVYLSNPTLNMNEFISLLINKLQELPPEALGVLTYLTTITTLFLLERIFGNENLQYTNSTSF